MTSATPSDPAHLTGALEAPLPGEHEQVPALVNKAIRDLQEIQGRHRLAAALHIGRYILSVFFDDDPEAYLGRSREHVSFQALQDRASNKAENKTHGLSAQWLQVAVAVTMQYEALPVDVRDVLPLSHHRLLLPIKDVSQKVEFAEKAAERNWSKEELDARSAKARDQHKVKGRTGRPRKPEFLKTLTKLSKIKGRPDAAAIDWEDPFPGYSAEGAAKELAEAERLLASAEVQLTELLEFVREAKRRLAHQARDNP